MIQRTSKSRHIPVRSKMSDEELAELIKEARKQHPEQFGRHTSGSFDSHSKYERVSAASEIISKWL